MRPSLLRQTILSRIDLEIRQGRKVRPSYLTGPPGVGKTQLLQQIAQDLGIYGHVIHAPGTGRSSSSHLSTSSRSPTATCSPTTGCSSWTKRRS
jgi:ABC-type iron transport system FetAB ATPase subunit